MHLPFARRLSDSEFRKASQDVIARSEATKQSPHQEIASLSFAMTGNDGFNELPQLFQKIHQRRVNG